MKTADRAFRVLFVQDHVSRAGEGIHGVTRYYANTLPALDPAEILSKLCVLTGPRRAEAEQALESVDTEFLERAKWDLRAALDLKRVVDEFRPTLLHVSSFKSLIIGRYLARWLRLPVVAHLHDANPLSPALRPINRSQAPRTDAVIAISNSISRFACSHYGFAREQVHVVHNGVDLDQFRRSRDTRRLTVRQELGIGIGSDCIAFAVFGRLAPGKGQNIFLQALQLVASRIVGAKIFIVGDGPARQALEHQAGSAGLDERVRFLGYRSDVPDLLAAMDFTVVPSMIEEGLGLVAIEAIASGLPVIAHNVGGLVDVVQDQVNGLLVEPGNIAELAAAIELLAKDDDLRLRLAQGADATAEAFSIETHVASLTALYRVVLRNRTAYRYA